MRKDNIKKTFSIIFVITLVVKALGLLRDIVFAKFYGTGYVATAFFAATRIPTQLIDIILSSAIISVFVPVFNEIMQKEGKDKANLFAQNFVNIVALISTIIAILGILFAPQVVNLLAGGFNVTTYELTVELIRITFPMVIFTAIAFSFVGFLQSYKEFNVPAMISGISNIVIILFLIFFKDKFGIHGVAVCMTFAWLLQVLVQLPFVKKYGYKFDLKINFKDENIKKIVRLAIPILISTAVLPVNNLVATRIASGINDSAVATLEYAYKLFLVISGVFTYAIGNIIFPDLSRASTQNDSEEYINLIHKALKMMSFLLIPLTIGIAIFRQDIISTIYQRGEFTESSTLATSGALLFYCLGILGSGFVEVLNKAFYAKQDTKTPLLIGITIISVNIVLSMLLGNVMGVNGLALSAAITTVINALILLYMANKKQRGILSKEILLSFIKMLISAFAMGIIVYVLNNYLIIVFETTFIMNIVRMIIGAVIGVITYYILTSLLKVNELNLFKLGGKN